MAECQLPKLNVAGSIPVSRSTENHNKSPVLLSNNAYYSVYAVYRSLPLAIRFCPFRDIIRPQFDHSLPRS